MPWGDTFTVTKLEAAKRQLSEAVRLFFLGGDPVAVHTLAAAGSDIVWGVNRSRGGSPMMRDVTYGLFTQKGKRAFLGKLRKAQSFFKHGREDPGGVLELKTSQTEYLLLDGIMKYRELSGDVVPELVVFEFWFRLADPDSFLDTALPPEVEQLRRSYRERHGADRAEFFSDALRLVIAGKIL